MQKKRDILREKRDGAKKREFTPESGNVDTYDNAVNASVLKYLFNGFFSCIIADVEIKFHSFIYQQRPNTPGPGSVPPGPGSMPPGSLPPGAPGSDQPYVFMEVGPESVSISSVTSHIVTEDGTAPTTQTENSNTTTSTYWGVISDEVGTVLWVRIER